MSPEASPPRPPAPAAAPPATEDLLSAAGHLAGHGFGAAVGVVRDTHRAISERVFWAVSLAGEPMRLAALPAKTLHDAISSLTYGLTGAIGEATAKLGGELAVLIAAGQEAGLRARMLQGVVNGMFGDYLALEGNPLGIEMSARVDAQGQVTPRLAIFIHGLCETDDAWFLWRGRGPGYGERLRTALAFTPVYVRYNSGRPIADNGRLLADLIIQVVADAPVPIDEIVLVGHSMGGLVAREALVNLSGTDTGKLVKHMVMLGVPHRGAPLEVAAEAAARVMAWVPETRALADALGIRAAGIKDLRHGAADPCDLDVDHYFFSAGLGRGLERLLGDLLVARHSAWDIAKGDPVAFDTDHYSHLGDASHFDLLGHPAIGDQLVRWLGGPALLEAPAPTPSTPAGASGQRP
jgi:pimeloyl-ACP methyl ester carboxylesterase